MKNFLHYINDDIEDVKGYPRWQWIFIPTGMMKLVSLLKAHARLQEEYPEGE